VTDALIVEQLGQPDRRRVTGTSPSCCTAWTVWTDDTLLARQIALNCEAEARDGVRRSTTSELTQAR